MTDTLKQIMADYDAAKESASFDEGHPIFQMASYIDQLTKQLRIVRDAVQEWDGHDYLQAYRKLAFTVHSVVTK